MWRGIPGWENYEVNEQGTIRHCATKAPLRGWTNPRGYRDVVLLRYADGVRSQKTLRVHRLVLLAFRGPPPAGYEASHLNGDRLDNRLRNLRWEDRKSNHARKREHGTQQLGEAHGQHKLTATEVIAMRRDRDQGMTYDELAARYGVSRATCWQVATRLTWRHL